MQLVAEPWESLRQLGIILLRLIGDLGGFVLGWALLIAWVAAWLRQGGLTLNRPTHFEARDGRF